MGTRSIIHIKDGDLISPTLVSIYRQYDGYPVGMGKNIIEILNGGNCKVVNGYGKDDELPHSYNTMGCLAAYLISKLKDKIGNVYVYPIDSQGVGEEYIYTLYTQEGRVFLSVNEAYGENEDKTFKLDNPDVLHDFMETFKEED